MTEDQLEKGKELSDESKIIGEKIFHLENSQLSSLYTSNGYHVKASKQIGEILRKIAIAHLKSELHRIQKEFNSL